MFVFLRLFKGLSTLLLSLLHCWLLVELAVAAAAVAAKSHASFQSSSLTIRAVAAVLPFFPSAAVSPETLLSFRYPLAAAATPL